MSLISFKLLLFVLIFRFGTSFLRHALSQKSSVLLESRPLLSLFLLLICILVCFCVRLKLAATLYDFCLFFFSFFVSLFLSSLIVFARLFALTNWSDVAIKFFLYVFQIFITLSLKFELCLAIGMPFSSGSRMDFSFVLNHIFCTLSFFVSIQ